VTNQTSKPDCPPWCRTDHQRVLSTLASGTEVREQVHRGDRVTIAYRRHPHAPGTHVLLRQLHWADSEPAVVVADTAAVLSIGAALGLELAGLVEVLADATPTEHRKLAAAIRSAAAMIGAPGEAGQ
jgi:hypothetical protein